MDVKTKINNWTEHNYYYDDHYQVVQISCYHLIFIGLCITVIVDE